MSISRTRLTTGLRILVSAALLGTIIWALGGVHAIVREILRVRAVYIPAVFVVITLDRAFMAYKWGLLLKSQRIRVPFLEAMTAYCASAVWGMLLPSGLGADAIRAYSIARRRGVDLKILFASIVVERLAGFFSALLLALASLVLLTRIGYLGRLAAPVWLLAASLLLVSSALLLVTVSNRVWNLVYDRLLGRLRHHRLVQKFQEVHTSYRLFLSARRHLGAFFGLTLIEQLLPIAVLWLVAQGLDIRVGLLPLVATLPLALLISRIPISFDGIGVFEGMFTLLMSRAGLAPQQPAAIALVSRMIGLAAYLPWWVASLVLRRAEPTGAGRPGPLVPPPVEPASPSTGSAIQ